jgi:Glycosyl transferase family 2
VRPTICLPTYNERQNIEPMLRALAPYGANVLVIDNNSPDGTGQLTTRLIEHGAMDRKREAAEIRLADDRGDDRH